MWQIELEALIQRGETKVETDPIALLKQGANEDPEYLIELLSEAFNQKSPSMIIPGVAALLGSADPEDITLQTKSSLLSLLTFFDAPELLLLVELIRSKVFGRGLGSRPQKLIRSTMEAWNDYQLKQNIILDSKAVYALLRLIHPRYQGTKAILVKDLLR